MRALRRRLRLVVAAWLVFQVVSLAALVPLDCCDAHTPASALRNERCHESAGSAFCPMRARTGRACPMHQDAAAHESHGRIAHADHDQAVDDEHASHRPAAAAGVQNQATAGDQCAIGGTCSAPMTALAVILASHGLVPPDVQIPANADSTFAAFHYTPHVASRLAVPDSPPPRA